MGLVHVDGDGFMDGIVLVRQIGIVFIIRIEVFQLSAENGNLDQTCLPVSGKEDAVRVQSKRAGQRKGKMNRKKQFFLLLSRIVCTGGEFCLPRPGLCFGKYRIGQHGKDGEHTEDIFRIMKKKDLQEPLILFTPVGMIKFNQFAACEGVLPAAAEEFLQGFQSAV